MRMRSRPIVDLLGPRVREGTGRPCSGGLARRGGRGRLRARQWVTPMLAVVAMAAVTGVALATDYTYCNECVVNSGETRKSAATRKPFISYVHRLAGPTGEVVIAAFAFTVSGPVQCADYEVVKEAACNPERVEVYGGTYNGGNGNYAFNGRLSY